MGPEFSHPLRAPHRILIRAVNWVGDTVLTFPAVEGVKRLFPGSRVTVLAPGYLSDLWRALPSVDEIIALPGRGSLGSFQEEWRLAGRLRKKRFDVAIIFPRSFHSALLPLLAGVPARIGYRDEGRSVLLTHGIPRKEEFLRTHRVRYYQKLIEPLGRIDEDLPPRMRVREEDREWAKRRLKEAGLLDGRLLLGMNPGATYGLAKCWLPDRFAELGRRLGNRWKASLLLFGKEEERSMAGRILPALGGQGVDLVGETDLLQLAGLLGHCRLLVTNDTGTMHVATAVGTPVVALFGPTDPVTTGPCGEGHVVIRKPVPCSPCLKRVCPIDHRCMEQITADEVEAAVSHQLRKVRP